MEGTLEICKSSPFIFGEGSPEEKAISLRHTAGWKQNRDLNLRLQSPHPVLCLLPRGAYLYTTCAHSFSPLASIEHLLQAQYTGGECNGSSRDEIDFMCQAGKWENWALGKPFRHKPWQNLREQGSWKERIWGPGKTPNWRI